MARVTQEQLRALHTEKVFRHLPAFARRSAGKGLEKSARLVLALALVFVIAAQFAVFVPGPKHPVATPTASTFYPREVRNAVDSRATENSLAASELLPEERRALLGSGNAELLQTLARADGLNGKQRMAENAYLRNQAHFLIEQDRIRRNSAAAQLTPGEIAIIEQSGESVLKARLKTVSNLTGIARIAEVDALRLAAQRLRR